MNISRFVVPAALGLMCLSSTLLDAHADTINVDFNSPTSPTYSGLGAASDTGTLWNGVANNNGSVSASNLLNSTGGATTVGLTGDLGSRSDTPTGLGSNGNSASALLRDYFGTTISSTITINGLTAGTGYNLYLYGVGGDPTTTNGGNSRTAFTVGGSTQSTTGPVAATTNLTLGEDYVVFNNLFATNNTIAITYAAVGNSRGVFNGFQLQTVPTPEPSTYAMMALGLVALCVLGAKRRKDDSTA